MPTIFLFFSAKVFLYGNCLEASWASLSLQLPDMLEKKQAAASPVGVLPDATGPLAHGGRHAATCGAALQDIDDHDKWKYASTDRMLMPLREPTEAHTKVRNSSGRVTAVPRCIRRTPKATDQPQINVVRVLGHPPHCSFPLLPWPPLPLCLPSSPRTKH